MVDLINRETVITLIKNSCYNLSDVNATNMLIDKLYELPSVQSKTGIWQDYFLVDESDTYKCYAGTCPFCGGKQEVWNYCGNCGAKLEAPVEETYK